MKITSQSHLNVRCEQEEIIERSAEGAVIRESRRRRLTQIEYAIREMGVPGGIALLVFLTIAVIVFVQIARGQDVKLPTFSLTSGR